MFKQEKNLNVQNEMVSTVQAQRYFEKHQIIGTNFMLVENNASVILFWLATGNSPSQQTRRCILLDDCFHFTFATISPISEEVDNITSRLVAFFS